MIAGVVLTLVVAIAATGGLAWDRRQGRKLPDDVKREREQQSLGTGASLMGLGGVLLVATCVAAGIGSLLT
ncbi:MAG: hypothetical protein JWO76_3217 [Nocardioides sp.]|nr:hypothetical protein [Nocardioides sp.]